MKLAASILISSVLGFGSLAYGGNSSKPQLLIAPPPTLTFTTTTKIIENDPASSVKEPESCNVKGDEAVCSIDLKNIEVIREVLGIFSKMNGNNLNFPAENFEEILS